MEAGKLRTRVVFQSNVPTLNSINEYVDTWTDSLTVWGAIRPLTGNRYFQAQQLNSEVQGEIEVRYNSEITATMRVKVGSRYLTILSIADPDNRHQRLIIRYKEALD